MITIKNLSMPPTVNHYYGQRNKKRFIKQEGLNFRKEVFYTFKSLNKKPFGKEKLSVKIKMIRDNKRKSDIDNRLKPLFDAMQHAGIYHDDNQIHELYIVKDYGDSCYMDVEIKKYAA